MIPLFRKFIYKFFYDEMAAGRWLRGGAFFVGGMGMAVLAYPFDEVMTWTYKEWIFRITAAGFLGAGGTMALGQKNVTPERMRTELKLLPPEDEAGTIRDA